MYKTKKWYISIAYPVIVSIIYMYTLLNWVMNKLSTLVTAPWFNHTNDDDCNNYEEEDDGKAHPFSGIPL